MQIPVVGCAHGEIETIYGTIELIEQQHNIKVDLLLCCGDFQATRNSYDMESMAQPEEHRHIRTFYKYYSGEKEAPILTILIGGNHEASNYLQELPFGGWVAPKIFYLGYAGVVKYKGLRIAGVSGIFKEYDYFRGHYEYPPYCPDTLRSVYHYREQEIFRLQQLRNNPIDIMMSHDWPTDVHAFGNTAELIEKKQHFRHQIRDNVLGSPPLFELLTKMKPKYWFSAHLHCKFAAVIPHGDKIQTKFLGLDKCLPGRQFLQILEMGDRKNDCDGLQYDLEWLTILYTTKHLPHVRNCVSYMPKKNDSFIRWDFLPTDEEMAAVAKKFGNSFQIPANFIKTAAPYDPHNRCAIRVPKTIRNQQTFDFCKILGVDDPLNLVAPVSKAFTSEKRSLLDFRLPPF